MATQRTLVTALALALVSALVPACRAPRPLRLRRAREATPAATQRHRGPPRIVVAVVLDQVGSWVLENAREDLTADGAVRRAEARGAHVRMRYDYAATYTAPGHAMLFTGAPPARSGVVANRVWDPGRDRRASVVDDGEHRVHGHEAVNASPAVLRVEGVADALRAQTQGRARVLALSLKDRGAVLPGGRRPDGCYWYDEDARGFTTSSYYAPAPPAWLVALQRERPLEARFTRWMPLETTRTFGPDGEPGEGNWHGLGTVFPHELSRAQNPYAALLATPAGTELLLDVARRAVREHHLGEDSVPDLLTLSISSTDYAGHVFGPQSNEARDVLARADLELGRFLRELERERGPVAYLLTADHGVAPLVERSLFQGEQARRLSWDRVRNAANEGVAAELGPGAWVSAFVAPFVYLAPAAREPAVRDRAVAAAVTALRRLPGVHGAWDVRATGALAQSADALERAVARSVTDDVDRAPGADVFLLPARFSVFDEHMPEGSGTSHGSPWPYDTDVPVLYAGPGVQHRAYDPAAEPVAPARVAATLAALLRIDPPEQLRGVAPLDGVPPRDAPSHR